MFDKNELLQLIGEAEANKDDHLVIIALRVPADGSSPVGVEYADASESVLKQLLAALTTGDGLFAPHVDKYVEERCLKVFAEVKSRLATETVQ